MSTADGFNLLVLRGWVDATWRMTKPSGFGQFFEPLPLNSPDSRNVEIKPLFYGFDLHLARLYGFYMFLPTISVGFAPQKPSSDGPGQPHGRLLRRRPEIRPLRADHV